MITISAFCGRNMFTKELTLTSIHSGVMLDEVLGRDEVGPEGCVGSGNHSSPNLRGTMMLRELEQRTARAHDPKAT